MILETAKLINNKAAYPKPAGSENMTTRYCQSMMIVIIAVFAVSCTSESTLADVRLPHVFSDHMVLQREKEIKVWGWASPKEKVNVTLGGQSAKTAADSNGMWKVNLPAMKAGGPYEMIVKGRNTLTVADILVGEVWICSGQSNMEFELKHARDAQQEIKDADYPEMRLLHVPRTPAALPLNDIRARWFVCSPTNSEVGDFSAVGYFFGREIQKKLKVPVGMITAAQGATQIEIWTPPEGLADVPALKDSIPGIEVAATAARKKLAENLDKLETALPVAKHAMEKGLAFPPELSMGNPMPADSGPVLYYGMISPLVPFGIRGALWYQGESNCGDGMRYLDKKKALIGGWRKVWQEGDFPFYFVQITPNRYEGRLPFLLEAQAASMSITNTGMAQATDTCDPSDNYGGGHPRNKQEIGRRLALWALAKDYGYTNTVYSGPMFKQVTAEGNKLRICFDHVGSGLVTKDNKDPDMFEVAGADGNFVEARARIDGDTVLIGSDKIAQPVAMRFAWKDLAQPNLMNKEGLPVSVFRAEVK